ncbi:MAG TPA: Nudix family hydrolase [Candidatus Thiothrix moscowensis]|uniref:Nudix family hydrolase n=1 Tax=unclassified Thiothrix TaxID=2636184 RepID=UPI0025DAEB65|nr:MULTISPECIES: Nudix family hydrolase [unclassified Thiothrix]HRJ51678.1 Nudix family hydrolase [Candidatus Thiothrix moscowensis]HRJ91993.1 Nudix family hydrolase [Candidatus Thiothrix moscowensis]
MPNTAVDYLHVVAAVIRGGDGSILLARRPTHKHQGGKWEFPGGKVEAGETAQAALQRELHEELGISISQFQPLIKVKHVYPERAVLLDVWDVTAFDGVPHGREGQPVAWFAAEQLPELEFPPANYPIITAARLPSRCLITPEPADSSLFLQQLERALQAGIRLVQFRVKSLSASAYLDLARESIAMAHAANAKVILNSPPVMLEEADGLHLTSQQLLAGVVPSKGAGKWLSAACHHANELLLAQQAGVDFAFLAPVMNTLTHPDAPALGWNAFRRLVEQVNFPVYALGGLQPIDVEQAKLSGGQGIAAIRSLWSDV